MASATTRATGIEGVTGVGSDGIQPKPELPFASMPTRGRQHVVRPQAGPPNPLAEEAEGKQPARWAPGIAACSADGISNRKPYGDAVKPALPFRVKG